MTGRRLDISIAIGLVVACFAIYAQAASFEFVGYDDEGYVVHNPVVSRGLAPGIGSYSLGFVLGNWHPLTVLSHALDVEIFGLEAAGPHVENTVLHALATLLLFAFFRRATGTVWRSALVAALFAVHPLHVEVVAWVSQRKTLLCAVFGFAALFIYVDYARRGGTARLAAVAGLLGASLLAKPMLVSFPILVALLEVWPLGLVRSWAQARERLAAKLWLLIPVAAVAASALFSQNSVGAMAPLDAETLFTRNLPNAFLSMSWYVTHFVWPVGLAVHYPHPYLPQAGGVPPTSLMLGSAVGLFAAIAALAFAFRRSAPWLSVGFAWWAVALLPVLGLVQVGTQGVADRYAYISMIGGFVVFAWGLEALRARFRIPVAPVGIAALGVVLGFGAAAHSQAKNWSDSTSLYSRAVEVSPRDVAMLFNLGNAVQAGARAGEAESLYRRALAVQPAHSPSQLNLAELLREGGNAEDRAESVALYQSVLRARPGNSRAVSGLSALEQSVP